MKRLFFMPVVFPIADEMDYSQERNADLYLALNRALLNTNSSFLEYFLPPEASGFIIEKLKLSGYGSF